MVKCTGKLVRTTSLGIVFLVLPLISILLNPIRLLVNYATRVKEGSFIMETFQTEVEGAHLSLYVFNITNAERFTKGLDDQLQVEEVGPFTYAEMRHNVDVDLIEEEGVMWFTPQMKLRFVPEKSVSRPELLNVTVPNLACLSATSLISQYPSVIRQWFNLLVRQMKWEPVITLDVHSYLWGYPDPLISMAQKIVPGLINFDTFGIVDRLYENTTMYRMKVGVKDEDRFSIKQLMKYKREDFENKLDPIESYTFENTYEGVSYPPGLSLETPINIYRMGVCRTFELVFQEKQAMQYGFDAWMYRISNETFAKDCDKGFCGMIDLSKCTFGIPIAMSKAHFLHADPSLYRRVKGMKPDSNQHDSYFLVEPTIGFTLRAALALQMNIKLGNISFNEGSARFSDMVVPVVYIKVVQQDVFEAIKGILKLIHVVAPRVLLALEILLFIIGFAFLAYSIHIYKSSKIKKCIDVKEKQSAPLIAQFKIL